MTLMGFLTGVNGTPSLIFVFNNSVLLCCQGLDKTRRCKHAATHADMSQIVGLKSGFFFFISCCWASSSTSCPVFGRTIRLPVCPSPPTYAFLYSSFTFCSVASFTSSAFILPLLNVGASPARLRRSWRALRVWVNSTFYSSWSPLSVFCDTVH